MGQPLKLEEMRQEYEALSQMALLPGWKIFREDQLKATRVILEKIADPATPSELRTFLAGTINWQKKNAEWLDARLHQLKANIEAQEKTNRAKAQKEEL